MRKCSNCWKEVETTGPFTFVAVHTKESPPTVWTMEGRHYCERCLKILPDRDAGDIRAGTVWLVVPEGQDIEAAVRKACGPEFTETGDVCQ